MATAGIDIGVENIKIVALFNGKIISESKGVQKKRI
jgi:hypothetical protein